MIPAYAGAADYQVQCTETGASTQTPCSVVRSAAYLVTSRSPVKPMGTGPRRFRPVPHCPTCTELLLSARSIITTVFCWLDRVTRCHPVSVLRGHHQYEFNCYLRHRVTIALVMLSKTPNQPIFRLGIVAREGDHHPADNDLRASFAPPRLGSLPVPQLCAQHSELLSLRLENRRAAPNDRGRNRRRSGFPAAHWEFCLVSSTSVPPSWLRALPIFRISPTVIAGFPEMVSLPLAWRARYRRCTSAHWHRRPCAFRTLFAGAVTNSQLCSPCSVQRRRWSTPGNSLGMWMHV